jgi:hypothetical protein
MKALLIATAALFAVAVVGPSPVFAADPVAERQKALDAKKDADTKAGDVREDAAKKALELKEMAARKARDLKEDEQRKARDLWRSNHKDDRDADDATVDRYRHDCRDCKD